MTAKSPIPRAGTAGVLPPAVAPPWGMATPWPNAAMKRRRKGNRTADPNAMDVRPTGRMPSRLSPAQIQTIARHMPYRTPAISGKKNAVYSTNRTG
jgi:hypothetical protein